MFNLELSSNSREVQLDISNTENWSVSETAAWFYRNGGGTTGASKFKSEGINEKTLLTEPTNDLLAAIPTENLGFKTKLREALAELQNSQIPPSY
ncbi:hypothetical protein HK100_001815 [Physocladia obscura]|uniref:SAM domain-containing protein n=1 Tax=Physocladia obscura TaxID=109957 RepID=A0AAD5SXY6_9FUNG|nr:hypothetical protein HK100_001815 [Physocladia obscura]